MAEEDLYDAVAQYRKDHPEGPTPPSTKQRIPKYGDEAAFPRDAIKSEPASERMMMLLPTQWGLTKRELFAAMAMQGFCAATECDGSPDKLMIGVDDLAADAVRCADALLAALQETQRG